MASDSNLVFPVRGLELCSKKPELPDGLGAVLAGERLDERRLVAEQLLDFFGDLPASPAIPMARYASAGTAAGRSWPVTLVAAFRVAPACAWWPTSAAGA